MDYIINNWQKSQNRELMNEYSNFYISSNIKPPTEIVKNSVEIIGNYINPEVFNLNKTTQFDISNIKTINLSYKFEIELNYKEHKTKINLIGEFIFTNHKEYIKGLVNKYASKILEEIKKFNSEKNNEIIIDDQQNNSLNKKLYENNNFLFSNNVVREISKYIKYEFLNFLDNNINKNEVNYQINDNEELLHSVTSREGWKLYYDYSVYRDNISDQDLNWLFSNNNLKDNANEFNKQYLREEWDDKILLNSSSFNLCYFKIWGIPLISNSFANEQINVYLTKEALKNKINNFGNLIYQFFKFFNAIKDGDKIKLFVNSDIFNQIKSNVTSKSKILDILSSNFRNNASIDTNYFWLENSFKNVSKSKLIDDSTILFNDDQNNKINWEVKFIYGRSIYGPYFSYIPFGSKYQESNFYIVKQ
ncbi:hypothetical protein P344_04360 [Spiroplasma mirum ATCC 29335]|uniref:Uncharacterized protein n=3 Tax=Spiroplasma mirum TaxID=2144 RepID=W6AM19_9MOLU|nr:hypothetical protein P344_04360 [Spiroplasma mirum ATCC 29335]